MGDSVRGWNSTSQSFSWNVKTTAADSFYIDALINASSGATIQLIAGSNVLTYTFTTSGWNKIRLGQLAFPLGSSTVTLTATSGTFDMMLKSLELSPASAAATIQTNIQNSRSKATWMKDSPVGVMYQWGQWGAYPNGTQPAWPGSYAGVPGDPYFNNSETDWNALADRIKGMGADFVVWSITWTQYYVAAPITSIDNVWAGRTTTNYGGQDYLMHMLDAFKARGLRVVFYYHSGHDNNPNLNWWNNFWTVSSKGYYARKETAMDKWMNIVTEIGNRYGTKLDGWMFDDGSIYYPAPYDKVSSAVRAGNPDRMVSFNSSFHNGGGPRLTDYEDFFFGENNSGSLLSQYSIQDGKYTDGPFAGEYAFGNFKVDKYDWGIRTGDKTPIATDLARIQFIQFGENAISTQQSMAYDMRMWTNLDQSATDIIYFTDAAKLAHAIRDGNLYNDSDAEVAYTGSGWYTQSAGTTYKGDEHVTKANGDSFTFSFYGTGADIVTMTNSDEGNMDIYVDGVFNGTANANSASRVSQAFIYSVSGLTPGNHTIKGVKTSGTYMIVDAFLVKRVDPNQWYKLVSKNNPGYVLDTSASPVNGTKVQMWQDVGNDRQQYRFIDAGAGYYKIQVRNNPAFVIDTSSPNITKGTQMQVWNDLGNDRQSYRLVNQGNGYYKIFVRNNANYLIDASSISNGGKVQMWTDAGNDRQQWSPVMVP
ncbi:RICIN domain-containing protein [Paenibacillus whitsoniae]|nr:RICIN domain-containing protein [Paenibacillus whitsoniae]